MPISSRGFFTTKPRIIEYVTLEIYHPAFGYLRYYTTIGGAYFEKTFAGNVYQPSQMEIKETLQDERNTVSYEVQLGRVGSQAKQFVKAVEKYPLGWMIPIYGVVKYWLSNDLSAPYRNPVELSVGNFAIEGNNVALTLDTANPRGQSVARRYNGNEFPGTRAKI
jgi:hypothetical protein